MSSEIYSTPEKKFRKFIRTSFLLPLGLLFLFFTFSIVLVFLLPPSAPPAPPEVYWDIPKEFVQGETEVVSARIYKESIFFAFRSFFAFYKYLLGWVASGYL